MDITAENCQKIIDVQKYWVSILPGFRGMDISKYFDTRKYDLSDWRSCIDLNIVMGNEGEVGRYIYQEKHPNENPFEPPLWPIKRLIYERDLLILDRKFDLALDFTERHLLFNKDINQKNIFLNLLIKTGKDLTSNHLVDGYKVLADYKSAYLKKHIPANIELIEPLLSEYRAKNQIESIVDHFREVLHRRFLAKDYEPTWWGGLERPWPVFQMQIGLVAGTLKENTPFHLEPDIIFNFHDLPNLSDFFFHMYREIENAIRIRHNLPRIGEGWLTEILMLNSLREKLPNEEILHQARFKWLGLQRFDVYIPSKMLAIEYNGKQHYEPVSIFGGVRGLNNTKKLDKKKREKAAKNGIHIEIIRYDEDINTRIEQICEAYF